MIGIKMDEKYLKDCATTPTSNDYYFKNIVTKKQANEDSTWYPYVYEIIRCNTCREDSGYMVKKWGLIFRPVSGPLSGFNCDKCMKH